MMVIQVDLLMLNSNVDILTNTVTATLVEVGHKDGTCLSNTLAVEAQSRISAFPGQIHSHEDHLGAGQVYPVILRIYQSPF